MSQALAAAQRSVALLSAASKKGLLKPQSPTVQTSEARSVRARLGRERIEQLIEKYRAGFPTTELMVEFGLSKLAVLGLLREAGVSLRRRPVTPEQIASGSLLYEQGLSIAAVAKRLGLPKESIRRGLIAAGTTMRPRGGRTHPA